MPKARCGFPTRLVAALVVVQLLVGVAACRAWEGNALGPDVTAASEEPPARDSEGDPGHHHADSGHHDCPETFLAPAHAVLAPVEARDRVPARAFDSGPTRGYEVPSPIPIG